MSPALIPCVGHIDHSYHFDCIVKFQSVNHLQGASRHQLTLIKLLEIRSSELLEPD